MIRFRPAERLSQSYACSAVGSGDELLACPPDAPTDREWREWRERNTISADEWKRYVGN